MGFGRISGFLLLTCLVGLVSGETASAATRVTVKTEHYQISGRTGLALVDAMDRRGPKHGFLTRAIAQTRYTMHSTADWQRYSDGVCRPRGVRVDLSITYVYPKPANRFDARLERRWKRFMAGVAAHEETHGRIAREMARAAERTIAGMAVRDSRGCASVQRLMKRKVNAIVAKYERQQERFDEVEHSDHGNVARLVYRLTN